MNRLQIERFEAIAVGVGLVLMLLGACALPIWWFWSR